MNIIKRQLIQDLYHLNLYRKESCTREESKKYSDPNSSELPDNIEFGNVGCNKYEPIDENMDQQELKLLLLAKQTHHIQTIKNCVVFFTVIAVTALIIAAIAGLIAFSALTHSY